MAEENVEDKLETPPAEAPAGEQAAGDDEVSAELGIEALKIQIKNQQKELEEERIRRSEAERRAQHMSRQASRSEADVQEGNLNLVISAIETIKRDNAMAKRAYAEALAAQNFEAAAEAQEIMSINASKLLTLENGRAALEAKVQSTSREQPREAPPPPVDPVEEVASQLSPRSAEWVRRHPEFVRDGRRYTKMIGAHNMAIGDGLVADTDEYFEYIEKSLGITKPQASAADAGGEDPTSAAAKPVRRPPPPAAPPSRGGTNGRSIRLTPEQREAASISGLTEEEYAANLAAEQKRRSH